MLPEQIEITVAPDEAMHAREWDDPDLLHEVPLAGQDALPVEALIARCAEASTGAWSCCCNDTLTDDDVAAPQARFRFARAEDAAAFRAELPIRANPTDVAAALDLRRSVDDPDLVHEVSFVTPKVVWIALLGPSGPESLSEYGVSECGVAPRQIAWLYDSAQGPWTVRYTMELEQWRVVADCRFRFARAEDAALFRLWCC